MINFILLALCLLLGIFFQRIKSIPDNAHESLNNIIIYVCLPALALLYIPQIKIETALLFPMGVAWIAFIGGAVFIIFYGKIFKIESKTVGALILTSGLCNTSFVGFPVLMGLYGEEGLKVGVMIDQSGSFIVFSTLGIITASIYSTGSASIKPIIKKIVSFPPFFAFIIALILNFFGYEHPEFLKDILEKLGSPMLILALISVGLQLKPNWKEFELRNISFGLIYKLVAAPLLVFIIYVVLLNGQGIAIKACIIEAAMPPMVMGAILASSSGLNPKLANLMVGIGIPLSFITLMIWYLLIEYI